MNEPDRDPTIYEVIRGQHRDVSQLLEALSLEADVGRREDLRAAVREALTRHARAEDTVFYDLLRHYDDQTLTIARHAERDHTEIRLLLSALDALNPDDRRWGATVRLLTQTVQQHVETEETTVFAAVRAILVEDQARALAETFAALNWRLLPEAAE